MIKLTQQQLQLFRDIQSYDPDAANNYLKSIEAFHSNKPWSKPNYEKNYNSISREKIKIMQYLWESQWTVNEIANYLSVCPSTVKRHLRKK